MYVLYTLVLLLGGLVCMPYLLWRSLRGAAYHRDVLERLGYGIALPAGIPQAQGCLWFHAASVGEVQGLQPIVASLRERFPTLSVVFSTFTPTGKMMARRLVPEAASVFLLPVDVPWVMRRLVRRLRPRAVIVQETELWPNLFRAAARQHVPVVVVNGRLSPRSFRRSLWLRWFMRRLLTDVTLLLVQSHEVAQRFQRLGAAPQRLQVVGNTNIDRALLASQQSTPPHVLASVLQGRRILMAGSTHEGEETVLLAVWRRLRQQYPDLLLVLAPRHLERTATVVRHVQTYHAKAVRRSQCESLPQPTLAGESVLVLDTLGELAALYGLCTVAFVGGSLVPVGGHNILEPAACAKPLFFGPHMQHFPELAKMLCDAGGARQVRGEDDLYTQIGRIFRQPSQGHAMGRRALQALSASRGALAHTRKVLTALIERHADDPVAPEAM